MTLLLACGTREVFDARSLVEDYLDASGPRRRRYAWPYYDGLVTNSDAELVSGDLLAPVLLQAPVDLDRMATLSVLFPVLQRGLREIPLDVELADADDATCDAIAALWEPLDDEDVDTSDVKATLIAKVLHRKRPDLIPLWDSRVRDFYKHEQAVPPARPGERGAVEYLRLLTRAMRTDLAANRETFADLVSIAPPEGPPLTALRALDIVVWLSEAQLS